MNIIVIINLCSIDKKCGVKIFLEKNKNINLYNLGYFTNIKYLIYCMKTTYYYVNAIEYEFLKFLFRKAG